MGRSIGGVVGSAETTSCSTFSSMRSFVSPTDGYGVGVVNEFIRLSLSGHYQDMRGCSCF